MNAEFNRTVVIDNIMSLIQARNIKVGELEKSLGVSTGYLSRLAKKENESALSAEFVWKAAQYFGVSMDSLARHRIDEEDKAISYIRKFLKRMIECTDDGTIEWKPIHVSDINHMLKDEIEIQFPVVYIKKANYPKTEPEPSCDPIRIDNSLACYGDNKVCSCVFGGAMVSPQGSVYHTPFGNTNKELYLACYYIDTEAGPEEFIELMLLDTEAHDEFWQTQEYPDYQKVLGKFEIPSFVEGVCNTFATAWEPISTDLQDLYRLVRSHEKDIVLSQGVKNFIDWFMADSDPDEELPF